MQAQEHFPVVQKYDIDLRELIRKAINEVVHSPRIKYERVAVAITDIAEKNSLGDYADRILKHTNNVPRRNVGIDVPGYNMIRRHFVLDCSKYEARDVYQASLLCKLIMEHKTSGMSFSLPSVIKTTIKLTKKFLKRWH